MFIPSLPDRKKPDRVWMGLPVRPVHILGGQMAKPTLHSIAHESGTSLATVDRVLNERPGVSSRTRARVLAAARACGYLSGSDLTTLRPVRLLFLLPQGTNAFIADLRAQVLEQAPLMPGVIAEVELTDGFAPARLSERLLDLRRRGGRSTWDGIALVALDHPMVREAVRAVLSSGVPVMTIASDLGGPGADPDIANTETVPHHGYVGIDNEKAGRLAGYLLGRFLGAGKHEVAFFAGSREYRGHQERELGFRRIIADEFKSLVIVDRREVRDDRTLAETEMTDVIGRHPRLSGLYNAGGATSGIARALVRAGRAPRTVVVAHDLTEGNRALLQDGTLDAVIDQNARVEVRETLTALTAIARKEVSRMIPPRIQIILRENLPDD